MHTNPTGAFDTFTVTNGITRYTKVAIFFDAGKQKPMFSRFSTAAGEKGLARA
ncbi:catalase [Arboricoccus pini]|uniref:Catalase n=1 Tax=Arboricoccus pini TaxID=1963835 RepID=A0A212RF16_9PROT|nr:catalase [Arboricoccus pini]SNB70954.1 catalase [Arboricoccus pini]